jgi:hypothetical protein
MSSIEIHLIEVDRLIHIEGFSRKRVTLLANKIRHKGEWTRPVCLEREYYLVMDGQHRMEAAKQLGLRLIPAILFGYDEVEVWSLRPGKWSVSGEKIVRRALSGDIYPYKTAKHRFPFEIPGCAIPLQNLMEGS